MKIINLLFGIMVLLIPPALSNNVQVSNVRLTGQDTTNNFTLVEFDISWENSWRYADGPANWDAAWIFVKYKVGAGGPWQHAWLNNTGHVQCSDMSATNGLLTPGSPFHLATNPVMGQFLYRTSTGTGNINCQNVQLRWNYGANGVSDNAQVDVSVFAIEFVYIPQGSFQVGTGGTEYYAFYTYPNVNTPYLINAENVQIPVGPTNGNLYYNAAPPAGGDQSGPVIAEHPKGFNPFYAMKYEVSQKAYTDFLNTLTRAQQITRVATDISGTSGPTITNKFVMSATTTPTYRNAISCRTTLPPAPGPVEFYCDLNNNGVPNDTLDGLGVACNYLSYGDLAAYLDWAALRLISEFEFEKCARGPITPLPNEFAWGNNVLYPATGIWYSGKENEFPTGYKSNAANGEPIRNGAFANSQSDRTTSGAGYYGCMELSGNVMERGVTIGNSAGRSYTGIHGNGALTAAGNEDVVNWPSYTNAVGVFFRGYCFNEAQYMFSISDRYIVTSTSTIRGFCSGGRGVRTAE